jgi:hypothetical protein
MEQLLVMITVPPLVGVLSYVVLRLLWKRQETMEQAARSHRLDAR